MIARTSGYYGYPFRGYWSVTQGGSLYPYIFNFVVDVIVLDWVGIVTENEAGPSGFGYMVVEKMVLFYADYGLIASTNPMWL